MTSRRWHDDRRLTSLLVAFALAAGCDGESERARGGAVGVEPAVVTLAVEGREEVALTLAVGAEDLPLDELMPADSPAWADWRAVRAIASDGRTLGLPVDERLVEHHRLMLGHTPEGARLALVRAVQPGLPEQVKQAASRPLSRLEGVTRIEVRLSEPAAAAGNPIAPIEVEVDGRRSRLGPRRLTGLRRVTAPGGRREGWALGDVLTLAAGEGAVSEVLLQAAAADPLRLGADDLLSDDTLLLRFNRQGALKFERFADGERRPAAQLRGVERIVVTTGGDDDPGE